MSAGVHRAAGRARRKPMDWRVETVIWAVQVVIGLVAYGLLGFAWIGGHGWAGAGALLAAALVIHAIVALHRVLLGQENALRAQLDGGRGGAGRPAGGDEPEPVRRPVGIGTREIMPRDWRG